MRGRGGGGELFRPDEGRRLPWLEADEDEEPETGLDTRRILTVMAFALALLVAIAAGVWWLLNSRSDPAIIADGSIIEAPDEPYKVRPEEAGGTQVAGTGNVSFAVAEGKIREGRIAREEVPTGDDGANAAVGVQIGAFPSRAEASEAWGRLNVRIPALAGRSHRIIEGSADSGAVFRLQAVASSSADAAALCAAIREDGGDCQVKQ